MSFACPRIAGSLLLALLLCACGREPTAGSSERPNLVLIVVDTLRADSLGCYGSSRPSSPRIDELARSGFLFENAQSAAPWTAPALLSLFTGLYPDAHGVRDFPDPPRVSDGVATLAELLAARGYESAAFTEGGYAKGDFGLDRGFGHYERQQGDDESHVSNMLFPSRLASNLEKSASWLRARRERPFFLFFHTYEPHYPYAPAQRWLDAIGSGLDLAREEARLVDVVRSWNLGDSPSEEDLLLIARHLQHCDLVDAGEVQRRSALEALLERRGWLQPRDPSSPLIPFLRDLYDAEVAATDAALGRLLDELRELGREEDTVVVVASDHGESFGEHGELGHGSLLSEVVLRMVLIVRAPTLDAEPRRIPQVVRSVDLLPTLGELLRLDLRGLPLQGRSLVPAMRGARIDLPAFSHATSTSGPAGELRSVRNGQWRYVAQARGPGRWLFDLESDPSESRDVAALHPALVARFEELLAQQSAQDSALRERFPPRSLGARPPDPDLRRLGYTGEGEER